MTLNRQNLACQTSKNRGARSIAVHNSTLVKKLNVKAKKIRVVHPRKQLEK